MRKVLIVAYDFPPAANVAIYRPIKFAQYLPEFGWSPIVLTVRGAKYPKYDARSLDLVPAHTKVYRSRTFDWFNEGERKPTKGPKKRTLLSRILTRLSLIWGYFMIPDNRVTWVPFGTVAGYRIIKREGIEHVFVTGKPFSAFLIGYMLKKLCGIKLTIDYRDPWTQNINYERRSSLHHAIETAMERSVIRHSDVVVANTRTNEALLVRDFGSDRPREMFVTIHNGFDKADFDGVAGDKFDKFTITYAGVFYFNIGSSYARSGGDAVMRTYSPLCFLEAVAAVVSRREDIKNNMQINFMGVVEKGYDPVIKDMGLESIVNQLGYLEYQEHLAVLRRSHALLLVLSKGEKSRGWVPSKFFSYLGSGNPVLGLVPDGEVRDIIKSADAGEVVDPDDVDGTATAIEGLYDRYFGQGEPFQRREEEIMKYDRKHLTSLLARALSGEGVTNIGEDS